MILANSMRPRPQNKAEVKELDWEQVQTWFQRTFFAGEDIPSTQRTAEQESPVAAAHRILTNAMSVMPVAIFQRRDGGRYDCVIADDKHINLNIPVVPMRAVPTISLLSATSVTFANYPGGPRILLQAAISGFSDIRYSTGDSKLFFEVVLNEAMSLTLETRYYMIFNGTNEIGNGSILLDANL